MKKHKLKSNRQVLASAIKDLSDMELVILRERILAITEEVIKKEDELMETMKNSIISPTLYINSCKRIFEAIDFKD